MENKNKRLELSNAIYSSLVKDEQAAIEMWRNQEGEIKLKEDNLPVIDVLTCVYNAETYIGNAIESVLMQSYPNVHLVIVTDPCTDRTIEIIQSYCQKHPNITLVQNETHEGIIPCFNKGLKYCNSNFIARMDLDDLIHPMRFEKQMDFLNQHPDIGVISCFMQIFNEKFEITNVTYREDFELQRITTLFYSPLSHAGSIFRSNVIKTIGYRNEYKYAEDYDLWYQIMQKYKTAVLPEFLYLYRTHSNQVTNEENLMIVRPSWFRIMENLFNSIQLKYTEEDVNYHIDHVLRIKEIKDPKAWILFHNWLSRLIAANRNSNYFNHNKLKQFVYHSFWQTPFKQVGKDLDFITYIKHVFSEINQESLTQKMKSVIKHFIRK